MRQRLAAIALVLGACALGCGRSPEPGGEGAPPNIVWIVAEDLGPYIPPFGDSTIVTPNLSRLAAEGIRYPNLFSPSGVCAPSRAAIATGMYPNRIAAGHMRTVGGPRPEGIPNYEAIPPEGTRLHSEYLRMAGYYATNNSKTDYQFIAPVTAWDESSPRAHWENRAHGQPFFAIFNLFVTHESRIWAKAEDSLRVDPDLSVPVPPYLPDTPVGVNDVRRMYSNIVEMDRQVGDLLDELEEAGLMDSTVIFWYTDHGGPLPRMKRRLYDSGLNAPLIVRLPDGERAGERDERLLSFIDLKPTLLSVAGIEPPGYVDGVPFLGVFEGARREYVHAAADRLDTVYDGTRAVRDARYKYIGHLDPSRPYYVPVAYREQMPIMQELLRLRDEGSLTDAQSLWFRESRPAEELFDTWTDPHEVNDVSHVVELQPRLEELRNEARRWMDEIKDTGLVPETELIARLWPDGRQPETRPVRFVPGGAVVSLDSRTAGASIGYQMLEGDQSLGRIWSVYESPIEVEQGVRIAAIAHRIGYMQSDTTWFAVERL